MNGRPITEVAQRLATRAARREGCDLVSCDYRRAKGSWVLRVTIDRMEGIGTDECTAVSRQLSAALDVEDVIPGAYNLEVSSPGTDRQLSRLDDYKRFAGESVRIQTSETVRGRREFRGILKGLVDGRVRVDEPSGESFQIPLDRVTRAQLDPQLW